VSGARSNPICLRRITHSLHSYCLCLCIWRSRLGKRARERQHQCHDVLGDRAGIDSEEGNILSRHRLGLSYNGDETPQDYEAAAKWFHRSADQENPVSQFMLSSMYNQGRGVPKNIVTAHMWLILSSAEGVRYALKARELNEQEMSLAQVAEAQKLAREWKPKPER
jgi:uncharacterized protein